MEPAAGRDLEGWPFQSSAVARSDHGVAVRLVSPVNSLLFGDRGTVRVVEPTVSCQPVAPAGAWVGSFTTRVVRGPRHRSAARPAAVALRWLFCSCSGLVQRREVPFQGVNGPAQLPPMVTAGSRPSAASPPISAVTAPFKCHVVRQSTTNMRPVHLSDPAIVLRAGLVALLWVASVDEFRRRGSERHLPGLARFLYRLRGGADAFAAALAAVLCDTTRSRQCNAGSGLGGATARSKV
jgi:hypothetical protein